MGACACASRVGKNEGSPRFIGGRVAVHGHVGAGAGRHRGEQQQDRRQGCPARRRDGPRRPERRPTVTWTFSVLGRPSPGPRTGRSRWPASGSSPAARFRSVSVPFLRRCMADLTALPAPLPYLRHCSSPSAPFYRLRRRRSMPSSSFSAIPLPGRVAELTRRGVNIAVWRRPAPRKDSRTREAVSVMTSRGRRRDASGREPPVELGLGARGRGQGLTQTLVSRPRVARELGEPALDGAHREVAPG